MNRNLYTIYDTAAAYYKDPWACLTDEQAKREFTDIFDGDNPIARHPEHYCLVKLATFDNTNGDVNPTLHKPTLLTGLEALATKNIDNHEINDSLDELAQKRTK